MTGTNSDDLRANMGESGTLSESHSKPLGKIRLCSSSLRCGENLNEEGIGYTRSIID